MAEIPVEKKEGFPWWLLLLGALLLGLLLWMFLGSDNDADVIADNDTTYVASNATSVNSAVSMDDVVVTELTGDMSFYAENAAGEEYFIVFDETPTPGTAKEGMLDINVGNTLDIDGYVRDRSYSLPATVNASIPSGESTFIFATDITKQ